MISGEHVNVNKGVQGGNFDNCDLHNNVFNINTPGGKSFRENYQKLKFIGKGAFGHDLKILR